MGDFLLEVGRNPQARKLIRSLGLPIPIPETLRREVGPWGPQPLRDQALAVGAAEGAQLLGVVAPSLAAAGATPWVERESMLGTFRGAGDAYGRPPQVRSSADPNAKWDGLVFDASGIRNALGLRSLYDFFHQLAPSVARSGRVVVVNRELPGDRGEAYAAAAVVGFVRSLAKELGKRGVTVNLISVEDGAESRLDGVLRYLLSRRAAFVTGQPIVVSALARGHKEPVFVRALEKKVALVTGAARGIGAATARALALEGALVACLDRPDDAQATSQLAREIGGTPLLIDIAEKDAPTRVRDALASLGGVDIVVHNAGITRDKTVARMTEAQWDQVIRINLDAVVDTTEQLVDGVLREGGRIILLASVSGIAGNVGQTNYAASKAGLSGYAAALAPALAERGITANAVAPGFIETRLTAAIPFAVREVARRMSALGQGGLPADIADAIAFLASPGAQGISGRTIRVCGGSLVGA